MPQLLEKAIDEMSRLPREQQDAIAAIVLEGLADEHKWPTNDRRQVMEYIDIHRDEVEAEYEHKRSRCIHCAWTAGAFISGCGNIC
jgi:hypothetical protein